MLGVNKLAAAVVAAVVGVGLLGAPASATGPTLDRACPSGQVPVTEFTDRTDAHGAAVDCLFWWDLHWQAPYVGHYGYARDTTRAEHAALLANLLDVSGHKFSGSTGNQGFGDIANHQHEEAINRLASLGVIRGRTATEFAPNAPIRRDQMASLFVRLHDKVYGLTMPRGAGFTDTVGNTHEDSIRRLVATGITAGRTTTTYDPAGHVTGGQMASFLMRYADLLVELGVTDSPGWFAPVTVTFNSWSDGPVPVDVPANAPAIASCKTVGEVGEHQYVGSVYAVGPDGGGTSGGRRLPCDPSGLSVGALNFWGYDAVRDIRALGVSGFRSDVEVIVTIRSAQDARKIGVTGASGTGNALLDVSAIAGRSVSVTGSVGSVMFFDAYAGVIEFNPISSQTTARFRVPAGAKWMDMGTYGDWQLSVS